MGKYFDMIKTCGTVAVAGHISPDGDCIGACFAVAMCLNAFGKEVCVLLEETDPRYGIIPGREFLYKGDADTLAPDIFIALDCADKGRLGKFAAVFDRAKFTFCIDHHAGNGGFADWNRIESEISSTCEIVYKLISGRFALDYRIASALYAGMADDTGGFRHSGVTARTYKAAGELIEFGIPFSEIYNEILKIHSLNEAIGLKTAIGNIELDREKRFAYSAVTHKEMEDAGITCKDFEDVAGYLINIRGMRLGFFIRERLGEGLRVSFRSTDIDVSVIAQKFGGGGHFNAAGATINAPVGEAVGMILQEVNAVLRNETFV